MISLKLREEARTAFLQKKSKELLDNNELQVSFQPVLREILKCFTVTFIIRISGPCWIKITALHLLVQNK